LQMGGASAAGSHRGFRPTAGCSFRHQQLDGFSNGAEWAAIVGLATKQENLSARRSKPWGAPGNKGLSVFGPPKELADIGLRVVPAPAGDPTGWPRF